MKKYQPKVAATVKDVSAGQKLVRIQYVVTGYLNYIVDEQFANKITSDNGTFPASEDDLEELGLHTDAGDYADFMDDVEFTGARIVESTKGHPS